MAKVLNSMLAAIALATAPMGCAEGPTTEAVTAAPDNSPDGKLDQFKNAIRSLIQRATDLLDSLNPNESVPSASSEEACRISLEIKSTIFEFLQNTTWEQSPNPGNDFLRVLGPAGFIPPEDAGYVLSQVLVPQGIDSEVANGMQGMQCYYNEEDTDNTFTIYDTHFNDFGRPSVGITTVHSPDVDPKEGASGLFQRFILSSGDSGDITVMFYHNQGDDATSQPKVLLAVGENALEVDCSASAQRFSNEDLFKSTSTHSTFARKVIEKFPKTPN